MVNYPLTGSVAGVSLLAMGAFVYGLMRRRKNKSEAEVSM